MTFALTLTQDDAQTLLSALVVAEHNSTQRGAVLFGLDCALLAERLRQAAAKDITQEVR